MNLLRQRVSGCIGLSLIFFYFAVNLSAKGFLSATLFFIAALIYAACGVVLYTLYKGEERKGGFFRILQFAYWLILLAAVCYFMQTDAIWTSLTDNKTNAIAERLRQILQILYFVGFALVVLCLLIASILRSEAKEAMNAVWTLGVLLLFLVAANYWTHIRPAQVDMTLLRKFSLSQDSRNLLRGVEKDVAITAFYPFFSDLYRNVELTLRDAASVNSKISYTFIDPLREKERADAFKVDRIGTILVASGTNKTKFEIVDEDALRRLERELVSAILQVSGKPLNIYYSQGHDEKPLSGAFKDDTLEAFDENLRALKHHVRQLTPKEGFPQKMPAADLVFILGPRRDFSAQEKKTILDYFEKGGKLFIAIDPESSADFSFLLTPLNVKYVKEKVLSDYALPPGKTTLQTINYSDHAITAPFVRLSEERKITIFPGAGYLEDLAKPNTDYDVNYFLLSHYSSWIDKIRNGLRDDK
ncbi:MAG TPA: Gldg family protein, partial [Turneriella sp.]|nr:Gldg family protein [Turneriella sp.]